MTDTDIQKLLQGIFSQGIDPSEMFRRVMLEYRTGGQEKKTAIVSELIVQLSAFHVVRNLGAMKG